MAQPLTSFGDLNPGEMAVYNAVRPPLTANDYRMVATQTVTGLAPSDGAPSYGMRQRFTVAAPRFTLDGSGIQSLYPPPNASGSFDESLAHVVLTQRSLPWSRTVDDKPPGPDAPPWLAVLMVREDELDGTAPVRRTVEDLIHPKEAEVVGPAGLSVSEQELAQGCLTIDLPAALFAAIAPRSEELGLLTHVRQVNTDGKEILGLDADGWFAVVVGNRLPASGKRHTALLVSVEGLASFLPGGASPPASGSVRMAVLASWSFEAAAARGNFIDILQNLGTRHAPDDPATLIGIRLLQLPYAMPATMTDAQKAAKQALDMGFVPFETQFRDGESAVSWYRGPLVPVITKRDPYGPYLYSDHAIRYDPDNGLFDMSYATAWQVGRQIALSDPAFAKSLLDWRIGQFAATERALQRRAVLARMGGSVALPDDAGDLLSDRLGRVAAMRFVVDDLVPALEALPRMEVRERRLPAHAFPGVLSREELEEMAVAGAEPVAWTLERIFAK